MHRALVAASILCAAIASAAPRAHTPSTSTDPAVVRAELAWEVAAAARGSAQRELWEDAAVLFGAIAEAGTLPADELAHAAHTAILAFESSLRVASALDPRRDAVSQPFDRPPAPRELLGRDQRLIHVLEVVARFATTDDESARLAYLRAGIWRRYDHLDEANAIYLAIVAKYPAHDVAGYSAELLLDGYHRAQKYDALVALAKQLRADKRFVAHHRAVAETALRIYRKAQEVAANNARQRGRATNDRRYFEACAELSLAIVDGAERRTEDDEPLYAAMICFEQAGAVDRALAVLGRLQDELPRSQLVELASSRAPALLASVGRVDEAATLGERWLRAHPLGRGASSVLEGTIAWRVATGDLDAAVRTFERYVAANQRVVLMLERAGFVGVTLAERVLDDANDRSGAEAARRRALARHLLARPPLVARSVDNDAWTRLEVARIYTVAACPVALVDGLCARPLDATLMATARREVARIPRPNDAVTLFLADRALDAILAGRAPLANLDADYRHLASSIDPDVRVAAHARLAALAEHAGDAAARERSADACLAEALVAGAGDPWRASCARMREAHGERLPPAQAPAPILVARLLPPPVPRIVDLDAEIQAQLETE